MTKEAKEILNEYKEHTDKKIEEVKRHFDVVKEDIDDKFKIVNENFNLVFEKLDSHTEMTGSMKVDIEIIKNDIEMIKNSLRKKVDWEEFETLEKRVRILESKIK